MSPIPIHQGRAAEHILFTNIAGKGAIIPNNSHFDATRAHVEHQSAEARDLVTPEGLDLEALPPLSTRHGACRTGSICRAASGALRSDRGTGTGAAAFHRQV